MPLYDTWEETDAAKQRARDQDDADIASGRRTREEVQRANGRFSHLAHEAIQWDKMNEF